MSQLVLNIEGTPKGVEVQIVGLGVFPNGETTDLTAEQRAAYEAYRERHNKEKVSWPLHIPAKQKKAPKVDPTDTEDTEDTPVEIVEDKVPVDSDKKGTK